MLVENENLYRSLEKTISQMYCQVHAIYEPEAQLLMAIVSAQQLIYLNPDLLSKYILEQMGIILRLQICTDGIWDNS